MRSPIRLAGIVLLATAAAAHALPGQAIADSLLTRAERSDFRETTSYLEVLGLSERLAALAPNDVHLTSFGYTNEGRGLPLLVVGAPGATPEAVRATGKMRVVLFDGRVESSTRGQFAQFHFTDESPGMLGVRLAEAIYGRLRP